MIAIYKHPFFRLELKNGAEIHAREIEINGANLDIVDVNYMLRRVPREDAVRLSLVKPNAESPAA